MKTSGHNMDIVLAAMAIVAIFGALSFELEIDEEPATLLHPSMAKVYREKLDALYESLNREDSRVQAADLIRVLIDRIELTPKEGKLGVELKADLAGILALSASQGKSKLPGSSEPGSELSLVAGARSQRQYQGVFQAMA